MDLSTIVTKVPDDMDAITAMTGSKPLRIAMLSIHSSPIGPLGTQNTGGMSVYVREVAKWMGASHHHVDIFTATAGAEKIMNLYPNVRLIHLNTGTTRDIPKEKLPEHLPAIATALKKFVSNHLIDYQMIHSHYWISAVVGDMIQQQWGCPHLTMFHTLGMIKNKSTAGESEPVRRISQERRLVNAVQGIVVPSPGEQKNLTDHYDAPLDKVHIIPCGVDMDQFRPMLKGQARSQLKIDEDAMVVLFVGRFAPVKGIDVLLNAIAKLVPSHPRLTLVVVGGDGPEADTTLTLVDHARRLGVSSHLHLVGRIDHDDLPLYYNAADVTALPSFYESFGLVTLESLACGTPVAATTTGGASLVVREGHNGTLVPEPDPPSVAQGLERVLTAVQQQSLSAEIIRESVAAYGWDRIAVSLLNTYNALLASA